MRNKMNLNFNWKYDQQFKDAYISPDFDDIYFLNVDLPHTNVLLPYNNFDENMYQFISCYRKSFKIELTEKHKRALLHFEGVANQAEVYVNQQFICKHKGGYTPFVCDITDFISYGQDNLLVVKVDARELKDIPPFGFVVDYLAYGGIYREVYLEFVENQAIENIHIMTKDVLTNHQALDIDLYMANYLNIKNEITATFKLLDGDIIIDTFEKGFIIDQKHQKIAIHHNLKQVMALWSLQNPKLYNLNIKVFRDKELIDEQTVRFGFREAIFLSDGFYLNGKQIKLIGLNRHQSFPYVGYAMPKSAQYKDVDLLKMYGNDMVRTSHYPQSKHFLDRCDEIGLLVFEEIPGWQHIGDEQWQSLSITNTKDMIERDWNHPSIILWGVRINESQDDDAFYLKTNEIAHQLDPIRQTGGVRNFSNSNLLEDVYTYNDFYHNGYNDGLIHPKKVHKKHVPYLITEFNGHMFPTKKTDQEQRRVEHAKRHLNVLNKMMVTKGISGAIGWCMNDYNTHKDFGSGDRICYHGVFDMYRIPKEAAYVYQSQQDIYPMMEVASSMDLGELDQAQQQDVYIYTNCDYVTFKKNGEIIDTFYPDKKMYPGMKHPPVIIRDFIGNLIEKHENMAHKDAKKIKQIFRAIIKYGDKSLPLKYKLKMLFVMIKYKISYEKAVELYGTYVANWGSESLQYEFNGYINDQVVSTVNKGYSISQGLIATLDKDILIEDDTYDVTRVVVKHIDQYHNVLHLAQDVIHIDTEGPIEIIGPKQVALIGGSIAFWVRSKGQSSDAKIIICSAYKPIELEIKVLKKEY